MIFSGDLEITKEIHINNYTTLEALREKKLDPFTIAPGTVLLVVARDKGGTVGILNAEQAIFNNALYFMPLDPQVLLPELLYYYFKNPAIHRTIRSFMPGTKTFAETSRIKELLIPIPPPSQQEQLLTRIKALLRDVKKAQALIKANQESIDLLLDSTLQEIFTSSRMTGWNPEPLRDLVTITDTSAPANQLSDMRSYLPFVASDINPVLARLIVGLIGSGHVLTSMPSFLLTSNPDVIVYSKNYSKDNWPLRVAMPYRDIDQVQQTTIDGFLCSSDLYQLTVSATDRILPRFLFWSLLSLQLTRAIKGNTPPKGKLTIPIDKIHTSELFFPKFDEQERICTYLDSAQEKVSRMYTNQIASIHAIEKMEESILNQAFAGEL